MGIVIEIDRVVEKIDGITDAAEMDFHTKRVAETEIYQHLFLFPYPVQQLLVQQYHKLEERLSEEKRMVYLGDPISCYCKFYLRYRLPCQHIPHSDSLYNILDLVKWERYAQNFKGGIGLAIYEDAEIEVMNEGNIKDNLANQKLEIKEIYQHLST